MPVLYTPPKIAPIPVIDIDPARDSDAVAAEIRQAAIESGFFYIKNHGVDPAVVEAAFAACERFFALPLEAKERIPRTPTTKGYEGMEKQHLDPGSAPDYKESWNCGWDRGPRTPGFAENKWPAELPDAVFKDPIETYYRAVDGVAQRAVAAASGGLLCRDVPLPGNLAARRLVSAAAREPEVQPDGCRRAHGRKRVHDPRAR